MNAGDPWERWMNWLAEHPRTMLYLVVVTTMNLALSLLEVLR